MAQSPQLYKQMAIAADFEKVYTIGAGNLRITVKENINQVDDLDNLTSFQS